ncbi:MAG: hypothetical protein K9N52_11220, partial [Verrucomicrobia bacterium]|nr:hypothetical protein [Verrucomicrobiota bacterium]
RIQVQVAAQFVRPRTVLHDHGPIPPLPQRAHTLMTCVEPRRIARVESLHAPAQVRVRRLKQKVMMVIHQYIGVDSKPVGSCRPPRISRKCSRSRSSSKITRRSQPRPKTWYHPSGIRTRVGLAMFRIKH